MLKWLSLNAISRPPTQKLRECFEILNRKNARARRKRNTQQKYILWIQHVHHSWTLLQLCCPAQQVYKVLPIKNSSWMGEVPEAPPLPQGILEVNSCWERGCHFLQCCSHRQVAYIPVSNTLPRPTQATLDSVGHTGRKKTGKQGKGLLGKRNVSVEEQKG